MTDREISGELKQLENAIASLEAQRNVLGDTVVDAALVSMREKLSALLEAQGEIQQRKLATVLVMDIVGSTSITRGFDPEDTMAILDIALQYFAKPVYAHGGRITNFMGDGFVAIFGTPVARENEPEMAVRAGLQILDAAREYTQEVKEQWRIQDFNVRVGINTGLVIIGGSTETENTILGATVNLAAQLEKAAKPGTLLISHYTYRHVRGMFDVLEQEPLPDKDTDKLVNTYLILQAKPRALDMLSRGVAGIETNMVGRDPELLMLQNMFHDAIEDAEVRVVTIVGDAGLGKSRLLYEFENWAELLPDDIWYFKGRATPAMETMPYGLFRRMFALRFDILESDSAATVREKFRTGMAPALDDDRADLVGQLLGFDFADSQSVQTQLGRESFWELAAAHLAEYLRAIAGEPMVIILEDIHWADDSSLDLLDHLIALTPRTRLLVVCLARPPLFERRPQWGEGQDFHTQIHLKPLSRRASRVLVEEILQKADDIPAELRNLIVEGAEGNPFYVEELIKMLIEDDVILLGDKHWQIKIERLAEVRVPPTLTGVLQARLDSLPPEEKMLLQRASVVGRQFWDVVVVELASDKVEAPRVEKLLDDVRQRELIYRREYSVFGDTKEYIFKHALLRDVTYETVLLILRRVYHAQVAAWLESTAGERINEYLNLIARHYELAGETTKAVDFLRRSGEELLQVCAFRDAINTFERALDLLPPVNHDQIHDSTKTPPRADLAVQAMILTELGNLYNRMGDHHKAVEDFERSLSLARLAHDPQAEIAALNRLAQIASEQGNYDKAQRYLDEVLVLARQQDDLACVASTLSMLSSIAWKWGDLEGAEKSCHESLAIYKELDNRDMISRSLNILGILSTLQKNYEQAEQYYEQALEIARENDNRLVVADLLNNLGYLNHHCIQNLERARGYYQESLSIARDIDHRSGVASCLNNLGQLKILLGELEDAQKCLHEALLESVAIGAVPLTLEALVGIAHQQIEVGQYESAAELLGLVLNHSALEMDVQGEAESVLGRLEKNLTTEEIEAAMERGKVVELDHVVTELDAIVAASPEDSGN